MVFQATIEVDLFCCRLVAVWGFPPQQVNQISRTRVGGDAAAEEDDRYWDTGAGNADEPSSGG